MKSMHSFSQPMTASAATRLVTLVGFILLLAATLHAQEEVQADWINPAGGWYSVATNWSTGTVPNNDASFLYSVVINQGPVISDQNATVNSLTIGLNGFLKDSPAPPFITLSAGTMVNDGLVQYAVTGKLKISGVLINSGRFEMTNRSAHAEVGETYNSGHMTAGTAFGGGITVNGTLRNTGSVFVGEILTVNGDFINDGTVGNDAPHGINRINGNLCNNKAAIFRFSGQDLITGIVHNHGTMFTPAPPSFSGSTTIGSLDNDGLIRISNTFTANEVSNGGTITLDGLIRTGSFSQNNEGTWMEKHNRFFGIVTATDYISLDGTLDLSPLASEHFVLGQSFDLATFPPGNLDGSFSTIVGNSFSSGTLMLQINYDENAGRIRLTVVPAGSQEVIFTPLAS